VATQQQAASQASGGRLHGWALASVLIALMLTLLLSALDQTIVGTALPHIIAELNGLDRLSWVGTSYLLTSATLIPVLGKLTDLFGRKSFLIASVVIFLSGSALCGTSQTMNQLIIYRGLQGVGAAGLMSITFTLVGDIFPPAERARWQGVFSSVFGIASVIGPLIGGWITDNTTWRWVFYVNLPIGVVALAALIIWLPTNISIRATRYRGWTAIRRIDWSGAVLSGAATLCLLLGLSWGSVGPAYGGYNWNSQQVIGVLIASAILYVAFFINERFVQEPILPLSFMRNRVFAADAVLALLLGMAFLSVVYYLPTFIQGVLGLAATNSGIIVTPMTLTLVFASVVGGRLVARFGRYQWLVILGCVIFAVGSFLLTRLDANTPVSQVIEAMLVLGLGLGCVMPMLTLSIQNAVPRTQLGIATSSVTYLRSLGSVFGLAVVGTVINNEFTSQLNSRFPSPPTGMPAQAITALKDLNVLEGALTTSTGKQQLFNAALAHVPAGPFHDQAVAAVTQFLNQVLDAARVALGASIVDGFKVAFIVALVMLAASFFLRDVPLQTYQQPGGGLGEIAPEPALEAEILQTAQVQASETPDAQGVFPLEGA
jgi:EmrB/QacA subfamily drug resistance transporter